MPENVVVLGLTRFNNRVESVSVSQKRANEIARKWKHFYQYRIIGFRYLPIREENYLPIREAN